MIADERDRIGARYLARLTDADLRTLVHADAISEREAAARAQALHRSPGLILDVLDRPATSGAVLNLAADTRHSELALISPFLLFAAAIHRTAADLATTAHSPERAAPRLRVPLFDTAQLAGYLAAPGNRMFLAELLAGFARTASGVTVTATARGVRRRRWSSLDAASLAALVQTTPAAQRPAIWRRLADLALFVAGVFPDSADLAFGRIDLARLVRLTGIPVAPDKSQMADVLEALGTRWYRMAEAADVPDSIERFRYARRVLNNVTDRYLFPLASEWFTASR